MKVAMNESGGSSRKRDKRKCEAIDEECEQDWQDPPDKVGYNFKGKVNCIKVGRLMKSSYE